MRKAAVRSLTHEEVSALVHYDPGTGALVWRDRPASIGWSNRFAGREAFISRNSAGYPSGRLKSLPCRAHQVAWLLSYGSWPSTEIDHINGDRADNRLANLRLVSKAENNRNMARRHDNTSGVAGVVWDKGRCKWVARIKVGARNLNLGRFDDIEAARVARAAAIARYGYHDNHGRDAA